MTWPMDPIVKQRMWNKYDKLGDRSSDFMWRFALAALIVHGNWGWSYWVMVLWGFAIINAVAIFVYTMIRGKFE